MDLETSDSWLVKALSSKHGSRLAQYEPQIRQSIAKLVELNKIRVLSIQQLRDICDQLHKAN